MIPADLVINGAARLATSIYPVDLRISPGGGTYQSTRFILAENGDGWVAGAWRNPRRRGTDPRLPEQLLFEPVLTIIEYNPRTIHLTLESGDDVQVVATRSGCACGSNILRTYNPFGEGISLTLTAAPTTAKD